LLLRVGNAALLDHELIADERNRDRLPGLLEHLSTGKHASEIEGICVRLEFSHTFRERRRAEFFGCPFRIVE
jgi:hypothetical protein